MHFIIFCLFVSSTVVHCNPTDPIPVSSPPPLPVETTLGVEVEKFQENEGVIRIDQLPQNLPIDLVDISVANLTAGQEDFKKLAYFSPLSCTQFWNIFPEDTWQGCGFWYGPSMASLAPYGGTQIPTKDGRTIQKTMCEFDTPLFVVRNSLGRNIRLSSKKVKGQIEFVRDNSIRNSGTIFTTAIKLPLGAPTGLIKSYLGGQSIDVENLRCERDLRMQEIGNWMQDQTCSFWIGPPSVHGMDIPGGLPGGVGQNSWCSFREVNGPLEFTKLRGQMIQVDDSAKKVMEQISLMMMGAPLEAIPQTSG